MVDAAPRKRSPSVLPALQTRSSSGAVVCGSSVPLTGHALRRRRRAVAFGLAILLAAAGAAPAQTATPTAQPPATATATGTVNLNDVDDVLNGQRVLADVVDLVFTDPVPHAADTFVTNVILETSDGTIASQSADMLLTTACGNGSMAGFPGFPPFPQSTRTGRVFDLPNDVIVTLAPTAAALGPDCTGAQNMALYVRDVLSSANNSTTPLTISATYVPQLVVADFTGDGYDDVFVVTDTQAFVATAADVEQPSAGLMIGPSVSTTGLTPLGEPTAADFNADGFVDVAWPSGNANASTPIAELVNFATVCSAPLAASVCAAAQPLQVILNPLSAQQLNINSLSTCVIGGSTMALAGGNFDDSVGAELVLVFSNDGGCHARAWGYDFDGQLTPTLLGSAALDPSGTLAFTQNVYAAATSFNWFSGTEQVATAIGGLGSGPSNRQAVGVVSFSSALEMSARVLYLPANMNSGLAGLATGVFGPPPGGFTTLASFTPQIGVLLTDQLDLQPLGVSIVTVDPTDDYAMQFVADVALQEWGVPSNVGSPNYGGGWLHGGDLQGRSVRVGNPEVVRISSSSQPQVILGAPPMHVDYVLPDASTSSTTTVVNFSAIPQSFQSQYQTQITDQNQSSNQATTSYTQSIKITENEEAKFGIPVVGGADINLQQVEESSYENSVATSYDTYAGIGFDASTTTGFGDQVWLTVQAFNIYNYPVIGQSACPNDDADCTDPSPLYITFSGPDDVYQETIGGSTVEWYQPVTEPGQVFSYPWDIDQLQMQVVGLTLLTSGTPPAFFTDNSTSTVQLDWSAGEGQNVTSGTASTNSFETNNSVALGTPNISEETGGIQVTGDVDYNSSSAFSTLNSSSSQLGASTGVGVLKPGTFQNPGLYQYLVQPFIFGQLPPPGTLQSLTLPTDIASTGALQTAFAADPTDAQAGSWWQSGPYVEYPDVALNHPQRWTVLPRAIDPAQSVNCLDIDTSNASCATLNNPEPDDLWSSEYYWMRGLLVTIGGAAGPQRSSANEGDDVILQARVYNYSLAAMPDDTTVHVRFYRQQWDVTTNTAIGDSVLVAENLLDPISPFNAPTSTDPNWAITTASFDTTGLGDTYWLFWVVVWMEDGSGNLVAELPGHGLSAVPGALDSIADVPLEMVTVDVDGSPTTTSFSNNVGYLHQAFYVVSAASSEPSDALAADSRLELRDVRVSKTQAAVGERVIVSANLHSIDADSDGAFVFLYDGRPMAGGTAFDAELLAHVRADSFAQIRVPFRARTCGVHELVLVAAPGAGNETRSSAVLEVPCAPPPTPTAVPGGDDDGCAIAPAARGPAWLTLIGAAMLAFATRCVRKRRAAQPSRQR